MHSNGAHSAGGPISCQPAFGDANAHDVTEAHNLLHGGETQVWCDAGYQGVHKREENLGREVEWQVAMAFLYLGTLNQQSSV